MYIYRVVIGHINKFHIIWKLIRSCVVWGGYPRNKMEVHT